MVGKNELYTTYEDEKILRISAGVDDEPQEVFFTNESPTFELRVENLSDKPVTYHCTWGVSIGNERLFITDSSELNIAPEETIKRSINPSLLAVQDSGHVFVRFPDTVNDYEYYEITSSIDETSAVYTFSVWDENFYKTNYTWPRRAQYASAILSVLIVLVGVTQLLL
jgi:hypothetical protein